MHTDVIREILPIIHETYKLPYGVEPTSIIMNAWMKTANPPTVIHRDDCKIQRAKDLAEIYATIGDRDCFSIADSIFKTQAIFDFFDAEFPYISPYENTYTYPTENSLVPTAIRYPSML
jgi:hypothetical protein